MDRPILNGQSYATWPRLGKVPSDCTKVPELEHNADRLLASEVVRGHEHPSGRNSLQPEIIRKRPSQTGASGFLAWTLSNDISVARTGSMFQCSASEKDRRNAS